MSARRDKRCCRGIEVQLVVNGLKVSSCRLVKVSEGQRQAFKGLVEAKVVKVAMIQRRSE